MRIELIFTACNTIVLPLNYNPFIFLRGADVSQHQGPPAKYINKSDKEGFEPPVYKIHLIAQILYLKPLGHLSLNKKKKINIY